MYVLAITFNTVFYVSIQLLAATRNKQLLSFTHSSRTKMHCDPARGDTFRKVFYAKRFQTCFKHTCIQQSPKLQMT